MWIIRWIVLLVIIVIVLGFSLQNQGETVNVHLLNWESGPVPLYLALFISFGFGMVAFLLIAVFQQLQTLADLSREKRGRKKAEKELDEVREKIETLEGEVDRSDKEIARLQRESEVLRDEAESLRKGLPASGAAGKDDSSDSND